MAYVRILARKNVNSLIRKIPYWKMPIGMRMVGVPRELLSIACWRKEKD
jgi:hypothetical protein